MVGNMINAITDRFREIIAWAIAGIIEQVTDLLGWGADQIIDYASQDITGGWADVNSAVQNAMASMGVLAIATSIFTVLAMYELCVMLTSKNSLQDVDFTSIILWAVKIGVVGYLLVNAESILQGIWNTVTYGIGAGQTPNVAFQSETFVSNVMSTQISIGNLLTLFLVAVFIFLVMIIMLVVMFVAVLGRMVEAIILMAGAPIPLATFASSATSNIGQNYMKNFIAIGLQGMLMVAVYAAFMAIVQIALDDLVSGVGAFTAGTTSSQFFQTTTFPLIRVVLYGATTAMLMFRTRDIAKILTGAS